jgi:hypothetical protein
LFTSLTNIEQISRISKGAQGEALKIEAETENFPRETQTAHERKNINEKKSRTKGR